VVSGECRNGAIVRGIDGVGLMVNVTLGPDVTGYEMLQLWLARVNGGVLEDVAGLLRHPALALGPVLAPRSPRARYAHQA
jgi:hypothetical protein